MTATVIKRGDTLTWLCAFTDDDGEAIDLTGATFDCDVARAVGGTTDQMTVTLTEAAAGLVTLSRTAAQTALWSPGLYRTDIRWTIGGGVTTTETFTFDVQEPVSNGS